ncbi:MAG: glutathione S-transferase N-terminal domain-containing protein [Burkholderiaceae bacterium]|nr:glutathione S-transferase N-terminal domain-containing protein [Burkholderiaceae bacterium]
MIDLYTWPTPDGDKIHIMLEECRLPYAVHVVDIDADDPLPAQFLAISPEGKIPALLDHEGPDGKPMALFEPGAILLYLAGKTGQFLPRSVRGRYEALQWLMCQHEVTRLCGVIDRQLARTGAFMVGRQYCIADIAIFARLRSHAGQGIDRAGYPQVQRWSDAIAARPAVRRALGLLAEHRPPIDDDPAPELLPGGAQPHRP